MIKIKQKLKIHKNLVNLNDFCKFARNTSRPNKANQKDRVKDDRRSNT